MAELIIGHTTDDSTTIWVRGGEDERWVRLALTNGGNGNPVGPVEKRLLPGKDFTWSHAFGSLAADATYEVVARFARTRSGLERGREVKGRLRTFPSPDSDHTFSFLHGSCNLSTVRMTHTGGLAGGLLGSLVVFTALRRLAGAPEERGARWAARTLRRLESWIYSRLSEGYFELIYWRTRFEQWIDPEEPLLPSPFAELRKLLTAKDDPARFMIHAGDQIYYDIPFPARSPDLAAYRRTYRQTWFEDRELRSLLAECPHYMIWDDHDIVDAFARDGNMPGGRRPEEYFDPAWQAYKEYVHCRQPGGNVGATLFYDFQYGKTPFFVLDTRGERYTHRGEMISERQMRKLKRWLVAHKKELKFVVSSVAFLAELRREEDRDDESRSENRDERSRAEPSREKRREERDDKWCGEAFREQRDEILAHVFDKGIERLVFLVGDMHCTYHATTTLGRFGRRVTLHELAGGPVYQLQFSSRDDFYDQYAGELRVPGRAKPVRYTTSLRRIHYASSSVLKVTASPSDGSGEVRWEVVSTARPLDPDRAPAPVLRGRISF